MRTGATGDAVRRRRSVCLQVPHAVHTHRRERDVSSPAHERGTCPASEPPHAHTKPETIDVETHYVREALYATADDDGAHALAEIN